MDENSVVIAQQIRHIAKMAAFQQQEAMEEGREDSLQTKMYPDVVRLLDEIRIRRFEKFITKEDEMTHYEMFMYYNRTKFLNLFLRAILNNALDAANSEEFQRLSDLLAHQARSEDDYPDHKALIPEDLRKLRDEILPKS